MLIYRVERDFSTSLEMTVKNMAIIVSGSLVYDHIMNFPDSFKNHIMPEQIHILNVCFMVDKVEKAKAIESSK